MSQMLLCWREPHYALVAREAKGPFRVDRGDELLDANGNVHSKYSTFAAYQHELLLRSTEILFPLEPAASALRTFLVPFTAPDGVVPAGPAWPHTHTLDVAIDDVHVRTANGICRLHVVTISGFLRWERSPSRGQYYVMERVPSGEAFAGALIATELREGHMTCLVFSPKTREMGVHFVRLSETQVKAIRRLKVDIPNRV